MTNVNLSKHKFRLMFGAATISFAVSTIAGFLDNIVVGNFLGEAAISAVGLVAPIFTIVYFISTLFANGAANYYTEAVGEFNKNKAYEIFGTAIIASVALGVLMMVSMFFLEDVIIDSFGVGEEISEYCHQYFKFFILLALIQPLDWLLFNIVYNDGDQNCTVISDFLKVTSNIVFAIVFCKMYGVIGVSLARVLSTLVAMIVLCWHFFRKKNSLKAKFVFKTKYCPTIIKYSAVIAFGYLFTAILNIAMNVFVIEMFGEFYIPVVNVIMFVFNFITICSSNGTAITPFVCVCLSEKNLPGLKTILKDGLIIAIIEGIVMTLLFILFGDYVCVLYGISTPELVDMASASVRWASLFIVFASIIYLYVQYYVVSEHAVLSVVFSALFMTIAPIVLMVIFGLIGGQVMAWAGWGFSFAVSFVLSALIVYIVGGKNNYPLLVKDFNNTTWNFNFLMNKNDFDETINKIVQVLKENKANAVAIKNSKILLNELCEKLLLFNKDIKRKIFVEISVQINNEEPDRVLIIIRDNGRLLDVTKEEIDVKKYNSYAVSTYISTVQDKSYAKTIGCNRSHFKI